MKKSYSVIIASVCTICAVTGAAATYLLISKRNKCREKSKNEEIKETLHSFFEKNFSGKKHRPEQEKSKNEANAEIESKECVNIKDNSNGIQSDACENTVTESVLPESDSKPEISEVVKENLEEISSVQTEQTELTDDKNETPVLKKKKSGGRGRKKGRGARASEPEESKENDISDITVD